jgi:hypothetical protein
MIGEAKGCGSGGWVMKALRRTSSSSLILFTVLGIIALSESAFANGTEVPQSQLGLLCLLSHPDEDAAEEIGTPFPTRLNDWGEAAVGLGSEESRMISLAEFPQGRLSGKAPFIDFGHFEMGGFAGAVDYSSKFKAQANFVIGVTARVPVPGLPLGEWGIWGEGFVSYINRSLPFYYGNRAGTWYGGALGGDYTFARQESWYLRGELGAMYAYWNGINSLDNGIGILAGAQFGLYWIKGNPQSVLTLTPQLSYDGKSWIGFITVGFSYTF